MRGRKKTRVPDTPEPEEDLHDMMKRLATMEVENGHDRRMGDRPRWSHEEIDRLEQKILERSK